MSKPPPIKPSPKGNLKNPSLQDTGKSLFSIFEIYLCKRSNGIFISILLLAVLLCIVFFDVKISTGHDDALYIEGGYNYAKGFFKYYYTANAPLYVMFLALPISIFGLNLIVLKVFSIIFFCLSLLFLYLAFKGRIPYLILFAVLFIMAINWFMLSYATLTYTEPFYMMVQALFFIVFFKVSTILEEEGANIKNTWKQWLLLGFMLFLLSLSRSIAVSATGVVIVYFLLYKKWLQSLYTALSFVLFSAVYGQLKNVLWGKIAAASQFAAQGNIMLQKDAYDVSQGHENITGMIVRYIENTKIYLSSRFWEIIGFRDDGSTYDAAITVFTLLLILIGLIFIFKKKQKAFTISALYFLGVSSATYLALQTSWAQGRFIMIHVPFILFCVFGGFYYLLSKKNLQTFQFLFIGLLLVFIFVGLGKTLALGGKNIAVIKKNFKGDIYYGYSNDWVNYLKMSEWCGKNLPDTVKVACRKAPMSFVYGRKQIFFPVYKVFNDNPDTVLSYFKKNKVDYFIIANLRRNPKVNTGEIINTMQRLLIPIIQKYPDKLQLVHVEGETEPAGLYKINY